MRKTKDVERERKKAILVSGNRPAFRVIGHEHAPDPIKSLGRAVEMCHRTRWLTHSEKILGEWEGFEVGASFGTERARSLSAVAAIEAEMAWCLRVSRARSPGTAVTPPGARGPQNLVICGRFKNVISPARSLLTVDGRVVRVGGTENRGQGLLMSLLKAWHATNIITCSHNPSKQTLGNRHWIILDMGDKIKSL